MREPSTLKLQRQPLDFPQYKQRAAHETDYQTLIDTPTIVIDADTGRPSIVYLELDDDHSQVVAALQRIKYHIEPRTGGMKSRSRVFGYKPRNAIRNDWCSATSLAVEDTPAHDLIARYAKQVAYYYQRYNPDLYAQHQQMVAKVLPDWRMEQSVFTSGIINKNNPLLYHFDTGNFRDVWSNMLVFKRHIGGGHLAVPEYDVGFYLRDNTLLMFDGQNLLHGVTPITLLTPDAYRYSIVYYSLRQMWQCAPFSEELQRARSLRVKRELGRAYRDVHGIAYTPENTVYGPESPPQEDAP